MSDDDAPIEGTLSDGTPIGDVIAEMPVEVRASGSNDWELGIVAWVDQMTYFPRVWVHREMRRVTPFHTQYVRRYKSKEDK